MKKKLTSDDIRLIWYLHVVEQLEEELSKDEVNQINTYIKDHPDEDMWGI